jgi:hypothetical protein
VPGFDATAQTPLAMEQPYSRPGWTIRASARRPIDDYCMPLHLKMPGLIEVIRPTGDGAYK